MFILNSPGRYSTLDSFQVSTLNYGTVWKIIYPCKRLLSIRQSIRYSMAPKNFTPYNTINALGAIAEGVLKKAFHNA